MLQSTPSILSDGEILGIQTALSSPQIQLLQNTVKANIAILMADGANLLMRDGVDGADFKPQAAQKFEEAKRLKTFLTVLDQFKEGHYKYVNVSINPL